MNVFMLLTGSGPIVVLTSHASALDEAFVARLKEKGVEKFVAYEIPAALAERRYGAHFAIVKGDIKEDDDLRVLDEDGQHAFKLFRFDELGAPVTYEPPIRWTPETPYVAQLFWRENTAPHAMFFETIEQLEAEIQEHKKIGLYARIWTARGNSANPNEWEEIENWKRGD